MAFIDILLDGVIKVWDYSTGEPGKLLRSVREHDGWVTSFLFWLVRMQIIMIIVIIMIMVMLIL